MNAGRVSIYILYIYIYILIYICICIYTYIHIHIYTCFVFRWSRTDRGSRRSLASDIQQTFPGARTFGGGAGYVRDTITSVSGASDAFDIRTWTFAYVFHDTPGSLIVLRSAAVPCYGLSP